jgi:hypothetical protein
VSVRQACKLVKMPRSLFRFTKVPKDDSVLMAALEELVARHPTIGFWKYYYRLRRKGHGSFYRQNYVDADGEENPVLHSTLMKMIELNNARFDGFKGYGHTKFYELVHFVRVNEERGDEKR